MINRGGQSPSYHEIKLCGAHRAADLAPAIGCWLLNLTLAVILTPAF